MSYLWFTTALWAFSFSLIGVYLSGQVDPWFMVMTRVGLAALVFLPFLRRAALSTVALPLMGIGGVQLGLMYVFYYQSFLLLTVPEVLIFTIFTPLYVTLLYDLLERRFKPVYLVTAALAVGGAAVMRYGALSDEYWLGFLVVQGSNLCFALGQVGYKAWQRRWAAPVPQYSVFGYFYLGAFVVAAGGWLLFGTAKYPSSGLQWGILGWLGVGASGLGYFLWNFGATRVNAGALAIMNNALIPAGLIVNVVIWNREADLVRLGIGGSVLVGALLLNEWVVRRRPLAPVAS